MKIGYIYKITNSTNGKSYIGSTNNYSRRMREHFQMLNLGTHHSAHFQNAYNKTCDKNLFEKTKIKEANDISRNDLIELERYYIEKLNTYNRDFGYNMSLPILNGGCELSEDIIERMSKNANGKKEVFQLNKDGKIIEEYHSLGFAGRRTGFGLSRVQDVIAGRLKYYNNSTFILKSEHDPSKDYSFKPYNKNANRKGKSVLQYDTNENFIKEYSKIAEATEYSGVSGVQISAVLRGRQKTSGGFIWKYK